MKKMFNRGLFTVLAAALVITALVSSCGSPLDGISGEGGGGGNSTQTYRPPAGMGYIRISLAKNNSRATFQPTVPDLVDLYYYVEVTDNDNGDAVVAKVGTDVLPVRISGVTDYPIPVPPGDYTVNVYASNAANNSTVIGHGTDTVNVAGAGAGGAASVDLVPTYDDGTGTFNWAITLPINYPASDADATFTVFEYGTNTPVVLKPSNTVLDLNNSANRTGTTNLDAGFYRIEIDITDDTNNDPPLLQSRNIVHVFHIAKNMTTNFTTGTLANLNRFAYNVTFNHNDTDDNASGNETPKGPYAHGKIIPVLSPAPSYTSHSNYIVRGWYRTKAMADDPDPTDTAVLADQWKFNTDLLINDLTLYAGWGVQETLDLTITFILNDWVITPGPGTGGVYEFSQAHYNASAPLAEIQITVPIPAGLTLVKWSYDGDVSFNVFTNTLTLTNNTAGVKYLAVGTHTFTAELEDSTGKPYYPSFVLEVTQ